MTSHCSRSAALILGLSWGGCGRPISIVDAPSPSEIVFQTPFSAQGDPLEGTGLESCAVYQEQQCVAGSLRRCEVYDAGSDSFAEDVHPTFERALLYDRWYDLYHQPQGQTVDRTFDEETLPGTPEAEWGAPGRFSKFEGAGDSAIWTGKALSVYTLRYVETGTEADLARVEQKTRDLLTLFDVTGVPGYLARYHYLMVEGPVPSNDAYILQGTNGLNHNDHPLDPTNASDLDTAYSDGMVLGDEPIPVEPMWYGNPSIDQYTGPITSFTLAYDFVSPELQERITTHLTCYLKRLQRIEIVHLQQNPEFLAAILSFLAGPGLELDPGDIDLTTTDTVVIFALPQINALNPVEANDSCPSELPYQAARVLDATAPTFPVDLLALAADLQSGDAERASGLDHAYIANVRGGDAIHLMNLAALAYRFTGDEAYRHFLTEELMGHLRTLEVAHTASAVVPPAWCRSYYGTHIAISPLWTFISQLAPSALREELVAVMETELWAREAEPLGHGAMDLYYAGTGSPDAEGRDAAIARALLTLESFGGNGGILNEPRRAYSVLRETAIDNVSSTVCPTEEERSICEDGIDLFGVSLPGAPITHACTDLPGECPIGDGCAWALAGEPVPFHLRPWEDYMWQRSPFKLGASYGVEGYKQSPGLDFSEAFWLARAYGWADTGSGQVLAWRDVGSCEP